ncbi:MAG: hypothetical protein Q9218_003256 [Villophora microphyllina]
MAEVKLETAEPDPSSTGIANDKSVNPDTTLQSSNPTADAPSKTATEMPSADDVDRAIAEVEAKKKEKEKETKQEVAVETDGHDTSSAQDKDKDPNVEKKEPSKRVQEAQRYNNRNRDDKNRDKKPPKNFRENYKSDLTSQEETSDPVAIRKQVEFYFSDSNLFQDAFLFGKVQGHDNLPVPISVIHSFKRMRHFQPFSAVVEALKDSATLNVVNEDHVQRKNALPEGLKDKSINEVKEVFEDEAMKRSVYVKGFGEEVPNTQFDVEAFFAEFGTTNSVRLRRRVNKLFKGSVFVEFDSEATQQKFLSLDPQPKWKDQDLMIKSKKQYCDDKLEDIKAGRIKPRTHDGKGRQTRDYRDWKTRRDEDQRNGHRRGGGAKGFGSHRDGRGKGGNFGGRRDRNDERRQERDERNVPKVATTADPEHDPKPTVKTEDVPTASDDVSVKAETTDNMQTDAVSKKRAREEEHDAEDGQASKKLDTKSTES